MLKMSPGAIARPLSDASMIEPSAPHPALTRRIARRAERTARKAVMAAASHFGGVFYQDTADRAVLENVVFPFYQLSTAHRRILFVGCDWYTAGYARRMSFKSFATIDPDPARARFGAVNHAIAPMSRLGDAHAPGSLDLVVCNGVIGWGLDDPAEAERSFAAAWTALRPGGHLVVGWNDVARHMPFDIDGIAALRRFTPVTFPPLGAMRHTVDHDMRHTFAFFAKPDA